MDEARQPGEHLKDDVDETDVPVSSSDQESPSGEGMTIGGILGGLPGDIDKLEDENPEEEYRRRGAP